MKAQLTDEQKELFEGLFFDLYAMYQNSMAWADNGIPFRDRVEDFIKEYKQVSVEPVVSVNFAEEIEKQMLEKQLAKVEVLSCKGDPDGKYLPTEILLKLGNETKWFSQER